MLTNLNIESSLILEAYYNYQSSYLIITFKSWLDTQELYIPEHIIDEWLKSPSKGSFYLNHIKNFKTMADKIIQASIDLTKIKKEWLVQGTKPREDGSVGIFANVTIIYNEKQDGYGQNGFLTQRVPKSDYQAGVKNGPILGNIKEFGAPKPEVVPGEAAGVPVSNEFMDDLPF